ncbi:hypothetical protein OSB04_028691 [Centaurea solstitialis]|uniref:GAG-pre-integrase domain-containing protein n=1 Tax=Centaurea solstitialis TaxID=347529 RepID=A0AA38STP4_9ASTR|nr:hypothetical protein OSB04_028691 [Centaurea solstitialis]
MCHMNFKNMNLLVKNNLVRGLPAKEFSCDDHCVACLKGKQHKSSHKSKEVNTISSPLQLLHMDLFGPTNVMSDNSKIIHILLASVPHFYLYFESIFDTTAFLLPKSDNFLQKTDLQQTRQENILEDLGSWFLHCSRREAPARAAKEELAPRSSVFLTRKLPES